MWNVTYDHLDKKKVDVQSRNWNEAKAKEKGLATNKFKMFDDDRNLYYTGVFYGDATSEKAFSPLDDYGTPNAGCTYIQYQNSKGQWETL